MNEISIGRLINIAVNNQEKKPFKGIHASAIGGCPRVHYWKILGLVPTTPPDTSALLNFKMGDVWEDTMFALLSNVKEATTHHHKGECWEDAELNLYGTPDYSIETEGKKIIVDSKTVNSKWFFYKEREYAKAFKETGIEKNEWMLKENHEYELQQGCYLLLAKRMGLSYDHARLLFVNKDNSFIGWELVVHLTEKLEKEILERISYLNECIKTKTLPRCECHDWKVGYCDFGVVETRTENKTKKVVNTECCNEEYVLNYNEILKGELCQK